MTKKENRINNFNLMVASLYIKYRKSEEHTLSAFWAKFFLAFLGTCYIFVPLRVLSQFIPLSLRCTLNDYLLLLVFFFWGLMYIIISVSTIKFSELAAIELQMDEYNKGIRLSIVWSVVGVILFGSVMFLMGPSGAGC